jgi:[CysO sulfur-carrier protein]-S-L-cysteine hydrolase
MLMLTTTQSEKIIEHVTAHLPNEACGLLAGAVLNGVFVVEKIYCLSNLDKSPTHFRMDAKEQFEAARDMRIKGWTLIGNFHSHPLSPAIPSGEDRRMAFDNKICYLIVSFMNPVPELKSFKIDRQTVSEEKVIITSHG